MNYEPHYSIQDHLCDSHFVQAVRQLVAFKLCNPHLDIEEAEWDGSRSRLRVLMRIKTPEQLAEEAAELARYMLSMAQAKLDADLERSKQKDFLQRMKTLRTRLKEALYG